MDEDLIKTFDSIEGTGNKNAQNNEEVKETLSADELHELTKTQFSAQDAITLNRENELIQKQKRTRKIKILIAAIAGVALIVLAIIISAWIYAGKPHTVEEWLELGDKYFLDMNYEQAIVAFTKAIEIEPKNVPARLMLAQAYSGLELYDDAEIVLFEVLEIDNGNVEAYNALIFISDIYISLEKLGKAETLLFKLLALNGNNPQLRLNLIGLAAAYNDDLRYTDAERVYLKLNELNRMDSDIYIALQDLYERMGNFDKLTKLLEDMRSLGLEEFILYGEVIGKIIDGTSDSLNPIPLHDVKITMRGNNSNVRKLRSNSEGVYSVYLRAGRHEQITEKSGYMNFVQEIQITANETLYMPIMEMIPASDGIGTVSGQIIDSITGRGIQGAAIEIYDQQQNIITSIYADSEGNYEFSNSAGYYQVKVRSIGYTDTQRDITVVGQQEIANRDLTMTPLLQEGEIRIVLTWGQYPEDLDSHLFGPLSYGGNFHIYYSETEAYDNYVLMAFLDLDDTDSYGPETTTIYRAVEGIYSFVVFDYTNGGNLWSSALANSGANIKVYVGNTSTHEFNVPPGLVGDTWHVFDIENGEVKSVSSAEWNWD